MGDISQDLKRVVVSEAWFVKLLEKIITFNCQNIVLFKPEERDVSRHFEVIEQGITGINS